MASICELKTSFTAGEASQELLGSGDLRVYDNWALELKNVFIPPTGGVTRRSGLGYIEHTAAGGKVLVRALASLRPCCWDCFVAAVRWILSA